MFNGPLSMTLKIHIMKPSILGDLVNGSLDLIFVMHKIWPSGIVAVRLTCHVLLVN